MSEAEYRRKLVAHNDAVMALLNAADPEVAAYMRSTYRLDLYPLDFAKETIERLTQERKAVSPPPSEEKP